MFVPGVIVENRVHYDVQDVPYKPIVVVPSEMCPESADPYKFVQDDNVIRLDGAQIFASVFETHSDIMEEPEVMLREDNPLTDEMVIEQGHTMWDQLCEEMLDDPQLPKDPESLYEHIKNLQDPTTITEVLDVSRRFSADPSKTKGAKKHPHLLWLLATNTIQYNLGN